MWVTLTLWKFKYLPAASLKTATHIHTLCTILRDSVAPWLSCATLELSISCILNTVLCHFVSSTNYICLPVALVWYSASWPCISWHFDNILVPSYPNTLTYHYSQTPLQPDIMKFTLIPLRSFYICFWSTFYADVSSCGCDAPQNLPTHSEHTNSSLRKSVLMTPTTLITSNSQMMLRASMVSQTMTM